MSITLDDLYKLIKEGNNNLKTEINDLKHEIKNELKILKFENQELKKENSLLKNKLEQIEKKQKKYNLCLYGLKCEEAKTKENLIQILEEDLKINCNIRDFRDVYRIGKTTNKPRPVLMEVSNYYLKQDILTKAASYSETLKKKQIYFTPDYTTEEYTKRKTLNKFLKEAKEKNYKAKIVKNKLVVNGKEFSYEELCNHSNIFNEVQEEQGLQLENFEKQNLDNPETINVRKLEETSTKTTGAVSKRYNTRTEKPKI